MFFGFKPDDEFIGKNKIIKTPFIKCSEGKGKCRGQLPRVIDGETKIMFVYFDMPEKYTLDEYYQTLREKAVYDEGIEVTKYTVVIKGDTYCWIE